MGKSAGGKSKKSGRQKRRPSGQTQFIRTYNNKLRRVNRNRALSGQPAVAVLAGYNISTGVPNSKMEEKRPAPLNPKAARRYG